MPAPAATAVDRAAPQEHLDDPRDRRRVRGDPPHRAALRGPRADHARAARHHPRLPPPRPHPAGPHPARQAARLPARGDPHDHRPLRPAAGQGQPAGVRAGPDRRAPHRPRAAPPRPRGRAHRARSSSSAAAAPTSTASPEAAASTTGTAEARLAHDQSQRPVHRRHRRDQLGLRGRVRRPGLPRHDPQPRHQHHPSPTPRRRGPARRTCATPQPCAARWAGASSTWSWTS